MPSYLWAALSPTPHLTIGPSAASTSRSSRHPDCFHSCICHLDPGCRPPCFCSCPPHRVSSSRPMSLFCSKPSMAATSLRGRAHVLTTAHKALASSAHVISVLISSGPSPAYSTSGSWPSCYSKNAPVCSRPRAFALASSPGLECSSLRYHVLPILQPLQAGPGSDVTSSMRVLRSSHLKPHSSPSAHTQHWALASPTRIRCSRPLSPPDPVSLPSALRAGTQSRLFHSLQYPQRPEQRC